MMQFWVWISSTNHWLGIYRDDTLRCPIPHHWECLGPFALCAGTASKCRPKNKEVLSYERRPSTQDPWNSSPPYYNRDRDGLCESGCQGWSAPGSLGRRKSTIAGSGIHCAGK